MLLKQLTVTENSSYILQDREDSVWLKRLSIYTSLGGFRFKAFILHFMNWNVSCHEHRARRTHKTWY